MSGTTRRAWLAAAIAALAGPMSAIGSGSTGVQARPVNGFDAVDWNASGELLIEQTGREHLSIEAEPSVLAKIVTEVRERRLSIRFGSGRIETRQPIRFRLEVRSLAALDTRGSGTVNIGALTGDALSLQLSGSEVVRLARLQARRLDAQLAGAGELLIDGGQVDSQRLVISGAANFIAPQLRSRHAEIAIEGSGAAQVGVADRLDVRISGSGTVHYQGNPTLTKDISGAGVVLRAKKD